MGTVCYPKPDNVKQEMEALWTWNDDRYIRRVLDSAIINMQAWYGAVEITDKQAGTVEVIAAVSKLSFSAKSGYESFCRKDMDETMGPCESECPERILNLLTPTDREYAIAWRERCRAAIEQRKRITALQRGDIVKFDKPVPFQGGVEDDTFTVRVWESMVRVNGRKRRPKKYLTSPKVGNVSLSVLKYGTWEVVKEEQEAHAA